MRKGKQQKGMKMLIVLSQIKEFVFFSNHLDTSVFLSLWPLFVSASILCILHMYYLFILNCEMKQSSED